MRHPTDRLIRLVICSALVGTVLSVATAAAWEWQKIPGRGYPTGPAVDALERVANCNIPWEDGVVLQIIYSRRTSETVLLQPYDDPSARGRKKRLDWEVRVEFPEPRSLERPKVVARKVTILPRNTRSGAALGKAVATAARCLYADRPNDDTLTPSVVGAGRDGDRPWVFFETLPAMPGGHTRVNLSKDLRRYQIVPGV